MTFKHALLLGGVPSFCMLTSTCIGLGREVPDDISGALQHFAAGVLLCTVGTELLPKIVHAEGWAENIAACIGFFCGVAVLILLGMFSPVEEEQEEEEETVTDSVVGEGNANNNGFGRNNSTNSSDYEEENGFGVFNGPSPTPGQKQQIREAKFVIMGRKFRQRQTIRNRTGRLVLKRSMSLSSLPMVSSERDPLLSVSPLRKDDTISSSGSLNKSDTDRQSTEDKNGSITPPKKSTTAETRAENTAETKHFPIVFVIAVAIDSSLDGLLIGIASAAGPSAGPMMSGSLSVEMGFLGLTLATALYKTAPLKAALAALVGPFCLVLAAGFGGVMADTLSHSPVAFIGMLSFGASALLFMVAEELLLDAHEDGNHVWWVDLQLYTGFFASLMAGKFAG